LLPRDDDAKTNKLCTEYLTLFIAPFTISKLNFIINLNLNNH